MSGFSVEPSGAGSLPSFFSFWRRLAGRAPIGDRGGEDRDVGRQRRLDGRQHLARALDPHDAHARRIGDRDRPGDERHLGAGRGGGGAMAWPWRPDERLAM